MFHFFVEEEQINGSGILVTGPDVNHIRNVLRMKPGERALISSRGGGDYLCEVRELLPDYIRMEAVEKKADSMELPARIHLFQGLPKSDKMELIIQKAVELGAYSVIPVAAKRSIVRLDPKREQARVKRWQAIAESAAKQSGRGVIPVVRGVLSFKEALAYAGPFPVKIIAYERAEGMKTLREQLGRIRPGMDAGIFIGPEGGFEEEEISGAESAGAVPVSLGRRILRTETAGLMVLSVAGYLLETM